MIKDFKKARDRMNDLLKSIDDKSDSLLKIGANIISGIKSSLRSENLGPRGATLLGWVPLVTATCPSELGTSSDYNCRARNSPDKPGTETPIQSPAPQMMGDSSMGSFLTLSYQTNPF